MICCGDRILLVGLDVSKGSCPVGFIKSSRRNLHFDAESIMQLRCSFQVFRPGTNDPTDTTKCVFEILQCLDRDEIGRVGLAGRAFEVDGSLFASKRGKQVLHGTCIQLLHVQSQKIVCINVSDKSSSEGFGMEISLVDCRLMNDSSGAVDVWFDSWFEIVSPASVDMGYLMPNDEIMLRSYRWDRYIHFQETQPSLKVSDASDFLPISIPEVSTEKNASELSKADKFLAPEQYKIIASFNSSRFRVIHYDDSHGSLASSFVRGGDVVRLFHVETSGFVSSVYPPPSSDGNAGRTTCKKIGIHQSADINKRKQKINTSMYTLWRIESVDVILGGRPIERNGKMIRLRHLVTGSLLAVADSNDKASRSVWLKPDRLTSLLSDDSIFMLNSRDLLDGNDLYVNDKSLFSLWNPKLDCWFASGNQLASPEPVAANEGKELEACMTDYRLTGSLLQIIPVSAEELFRFGLIKDLGFNLSGRIPLFIADMKKSLSDHHVESKQSSVLSSSSIHLLPIIHILDRLIDTLRHYEIDVDESIRDSNKNSLDTRSLQKLIRESGIVTMLLQSLDSLFGTDNKPSCPLRLSSSRSMSRSISMAVEMDSSYSLEQQKMNISANPDVKQYIETVLSFGIRFVRGNHWNQDLVSKHSSLFCHMLGQSPLVSQLWTELYKNNRDLVEAIEEACIIKVFDFLSAEILQVDFILFLNALCYSSSTTLVPRNMEIISQILIRERPFLLPRYRMAADLHERTFEIGLSSQKSEKTVTWYSGADAMKYFLSCQRLLSTLAKSGDFSLQSDIENLPCYGFDDIMGMIEDMSVPIIVRSSFVSFIATVYLDQSIAIHMSSYSRVRIMESGKSSLDMAKLFCLRSTSGDVDSGSDSESEEKEVKPSSRWSRISRALGKVQIDRRLVFQSRIEKLKIFSTNFFKNESSRLIAAIESERSHSIGGNAMSTRNFDGFSQNNSSMIVQVLSLTSSLIKYNGIKAREQIKDLATVIQSLACLVSKKLLFDDNISVRTGGAQMMTHLILVVHDILTVHMNDSLNEVIDCVYSSKNVKSSNEPINTEVHWRLNNCGLDLDILSNVLVVSSKHSDFKLVSGVFQLLFRIFNFPLNLLEEVPQLVMIEDDERLFFLKTIKISTYLRQFFSRRHTENEKMGLITRIQTISRKFQLENAKDAQRLENICTAGGMTDSVVKFVKKSLVTRHIDSDAITQALLELLRVLTVSNLHPCRRRFIRHIDCFLELLPASGDFVLTLLNGNSEMISSLADSHLNIIFQRIVADSMSRPHLGAYRAPNPLFIRILKELVCCDDCPVESMQNCVLLKVMQLCHDRIESHKLAIFSIFTAPCLKTALLNIVGPPATDGQSIVALDDVQPDRQIATEFTIEMLNLAALCCYGLNHLTEIQCRTLFSLDSICEAIASNEVPVLFKPALLSLIANAHFIVKKISPFITESWPVWQLIKYCREEIGLLWHSLESIVSGEEKEQEGARNRVSEKSSFVIDYLIPTIGVFFNNVYERRRSSAVSTHWQIDECKRLLHEASCLLDISCNDIISRILTEDQVKRVEMLLVNVFGSDSQIFEKQVSAEGQSYRMSQPSKIQKLESITDAGIELLDIAIQTINEKSIVMTTDNSSAQQTSTQRDSRSQSKVTEDDLLQSKIRKALFKFQAVNESQEKKLLDSSIHGTKRNATVPSDQKTVQFDVSVPEMSFRQRIICKISNDDLVMKKLRKEILSRKERHAFVRLLQSPSYDIVLQKMLSLMDFVVTNSKQESDSGEYHDNESINDDFENILIHGLRLLHLVVTNTRNDEEKFAQQIRLSKLGVTHTMLKLGCNIEESNPLYYTMLDEVFRFGVALVDGGHTEIQNGFLNCLTNTSLDEAFFTAIVSMIRRAATILVERRQGEMFSSEVRSEALDNIHSRSFSSSQSPNFKRSATSLTGGMRYSASSSNLSDTDTFTSDDDEESESHQLGVRIQNEEKTGIVVVVNGRLFSIPKESRIPTSSLILFDAFEFLRLLCENHQIELQNYLREQHDNIRSFNIIEEVLSYLRSLVFATDPSTFDVTIQSQIGNITLCEQVVSCLVEFVQGNPASQAYLGSLASVVFSMNDILFQSLFSICQAIEIDFRKWHQSRLQRRKTRWNAVVMPKTLFRNYSGLSEEHGYAANDCNNRGDLSSKIKFALEIYKRRFKKSAETDDESVELDIQSIISDYFSEIHSTEEVFADLNTSREVIVMHCNIQRSVVTLLTSLLEGSCHKEVRENITKNLDFDVVASLVNLRNGFRENQETCIFKELLRSRLNASDFETKTDTEIAKFPRAVMLEDINRSEATRKSSLFFLLPGSLRSVPDTSYTAFALSDSRTEDDIGSFVSLLRITFPEKSTSQIRVDLGEAYNFLGGWKDLVSCIEIQRNGELERASFPIPKECIQFWHHPSVAESRRRLIYGVYSENQDQKLGNFLQQGTDLLAEIDYVSILGEYKLIRYLTEKEKVWMTSTFMIAIVINLLDVFRGERTGFVSYPLGVIHCILSLGRLACYALNRQQQFLNEHIKWLLMMKKPPSREENEFDALVRRLVNWLSSRILLAPVCTTETKTENNSNLDYNDDSDHKVVMSDFEIDNVANSTKILPSDFPVAYRVWIVIWGSRYHVFYLLLSLVGNLLLIVPDYRLRSAVFSFNLIDICVRYRVMERMLAAIRLNGSALLQSALLFFVIIFIYSNWGFALFHEDYRILGPSIPSGCDTATQCLATHFNYGLREDAGISETMAVVDFSEGPNRVAGRFFFDVSYWIVVTVILLNIVSGIIIDSFAQLRDQRANVEKSILRRCFLCGLDSDLFNRFGGGFDHHTKNEHFIWDYLFFIQHLKNKPEEEYTGQESYVKNMLTQDNHTWLPIGKAIALSKIKTAAV